MHVGHARPSVRRLDPLSGSPDEASARADFPRAGRVEESKRETGTGGFRNRARRGTHLRPVASARSSRARTSRRRAAGPAAATASSQLFSSSQPATDREKHAINFVSSFLRVVRRGLRNGDDTHEDIRSLVFPSRKLTPIRATGPSRERNNTRHDVLCRASQARTRKTPVLASLDDSTGR